MKYKVIKTGSSENCFLFGDDLLLDAGMPYSRLSKAVNLKLVTHLLLTHKHGDHFKDTTIRKLFVSTDIVFVCADFLVEELLKLKITKDRIFIVDVGKVYEVGNFKISPVLAYHDVPNIGYRLYKEGKKHLHITDTGTVEGIVAKNYDSVTLECNHCALKALELIEEAKAQGEFEHLTRAMQNHLSVQKAIEFCKLNDIKKITPVHVGESTRKEVIEALKGV